MLKVAQLQAGYGRTQILFGIDLEVKAGEIVTIIGANGAGKTTTLRTISGLTKVYSGSIEFKGRSISGMSPEEIARLGLAHCPEGRHILQRLTVEENLIAGYIPGRGRPYEDIRADVFEMFPLLKERRNSLASRMSGGQQQMLAIGRSLMASPELLMLDEPSLGLAPKIINQIFEIIIQLSKAGISLIVVEQNAAVALEIADYGYVFDAGRCTVEGGAHKVLHDPQLQAAYLGG
ncbi:ABC transporter ATP-binding protein [Brucella sp. YY2X]|uniref:ABC transporter ATP-binding protein n=1 Tax=Ochrobactrum chromiisoli TaxID=2993941 RepID=A0ABT3QSW5_9HYPH|nr:ABC transporter ATP-binding protein [Ochrobactrum chromiisoli]